MTSDDVCCFCQGAAVEGRRRKVALRRGSETRHIELSRCTNCQRAHRWALIAFVAIWLLAGWGAAAWLFWSWFESGVRPRGAGGLVLASTVLASLPGLGLAVLAHRLIPRMLGAIPVATAITRDPEGRRLRSAGFEPVTR